MKPLFTVPKLVKYDDLSKTWYVFFRYNGKLIKKTKEINRIKNYKARLTAGEALAKAYHIKLKSGWNPTIPDTPEEAQMTLYAALDFALEKKWPNLADKTRKGYRCTLRVMKTAIQDTGLGPLLISETKRAHIKIILESAKNSRKWSNKAYNKGLHNLQAILSELIQWDILEFNPAHKIKPLKVMITEANTPPTPSQMREIKYHVSKKDYNYWEFLLVLFHTGIRPWEIAQMTVKMVDTRSKVFKLPAEITKTRMDREVPINEHLWPHISHRLNNPDNYYLFASHRISGRGNEGRFADFIPGPTKLKRDTSTRRWERLVKIDLGIQCNQYSFKKAGANAKIAAGMSIRALQELYGHQSEVTTEIYITDIKRVMQKEIMERSPAL